MLVAGPREQMKTTSSQISCFSTCRSFLPCWNPTLGFFLSWCCFFPPGTPSPANHHLSQMAADPRGVSSPLVAYGASLPGREALDPSHPLPPSPRGRCPSEGRAHLGRSSVARGQGKWAEISVPSIPMSERKNGIVIFVFAAHINVLQRARGQCDMTHGLLLGEFAGTRLLFFLLQLIEMRLSACRA